MITYLAVSAVLNIALGYALAVYLGHTRVQHTVIAAPPRPIQPPTPVPPSPAATPVPVDAQPAPVQAKDDKGWAEKFLKSELANLPQEQIAAETPPAAASDSKAPPAMPPTAEIGEAEPAPVADMTTELEEPETAAAEPAAPSAEVEQELLAGIEEFRNQLAQLKDGTDDQPAAGRLAEVQTN